MCQIQNKRRVLHDEGCLFRKTEFLCEPTDGSTDMRRSILKSILQQCRENDSKSENGDNSLEFIQVCQDFFWNHFTSTPHRSETNGIDETEVRMLFHMSQSRGCWCSWRRSSSPCVAVQRRQWRGTWHRKVCFSGIQSPTWRCCVCEQTSRLAVQRRR